MVIWDWMESVTFERGGFTAKKTVRPHDHSTQLIDNRVLA